MRIICLLFLAACAWGAEWKLGPATENTVDLYVDKTGIMSGKRHWFRFPQLTGSFSENPAKFELKFDVKALQCFDTWLNAKDQKTVLSWTLGKETLDAEHHPTVTFISTAVEGEKVTGNLTIRGITKPVIVIAKKVADGKFEGSATFKMTDFGIKPAKAGLNTIGTKDEMTLQFKLTGTR
jgi:polyisoprenoid-binding protein YceI